MKKKLTVLIFSAALMLLTLGPGISSAQSDDWSISNSESNFFTVSSQGTIDNGVTNVRFQGWATSTFAGGYVEPIELYIWAKAEVNRYKGSTDSDPYTKTREFASGEEQQYVSVNIDSSFSNSWLSSAKVYAEGYLEFKDGDDDTYWYLIAAGDRGLE